MKKLYATFNLIRLTRLTLGQVFGILLSSLILKRWTALILVVILTLPHTSFADLQCRALFQPEFGDVTEKIKAQDAALFKIAVHHFYKNATQFLQKKVTTSSYRNTRAIREFNKLNLDYYLKTGNAEEAYHLYETIFDNVELSYWSIKNDLKSVEELKKMSSDAKVIAKGRAWWRLKLRLRVYSNRFAKSFDEYSEIRPYLEARAALEKPASELSLSEQTARQVLEKLKVDEFSREKPDFVVLDIPPERPKMDDIAELFKNDHEFVTRALFQEFKGEILAVAKFVMTGEWAVGMLENVFNRFPSEVAFKLKNMTGLMKSMRLRFRTLPLIVMNETLPSHNAEALKIRLDDLRIKNTLTAEDELLITYARVVEFSDTWKELKDFAAKYGEESKNKTYQKFASRMEAAELKAETLPDISLLAHTSNIDALYTIIHTGILLYIFGPSVYADGGFNFWHVLADIPALTAPLLSSLKK